MPPILWALSGSLLYSGLFIALDLRLSRYTPQSLQAYFYPVMFLVAVSWLVARRGTGVENTFPPSGLLVFIALLGVMYYFADAFTFKAFESGVSVIAVALAMCMMPVFSSAMKFFFTGVRPNIYHLFAFALAFVVVALAVKGDTLAQ